MRPYTSGRMRQILPTACDSFDCAVKVGAEPPISPHKRKRNSVCGPMADLGYDGKVAIITGAGGGLGREHALLLASRGAQIVVNDLGGGVAGGDGGSLGPAETVVKEIEDAGGVAVADGNSVATPEGGEAIVKTALDAFGKVDIVINNAGILRDKTFHNMTPEFVDPVLDVHLRGAFWVTKPAWIKMREQGYGRIVNTSSNSGILGNFGQSNYGAAKMGLVGVAEHTSVRRGEDEPAVAVLLHHPERGPADVEGTLEVHVQNRVEVVVGQLGERLVTQDAGVVDDDVDLAEGVDRGLDDVLAALGRRDRVVVGHRLAAGRLDFVDDLLRGGVVAALPVDGPAEVVDDHASAAPGEVEGVRAAQAATSTGDDRDPAVEGDLGHVHSRKVVGHSQNGILPRAPSAVARGWQTAPMSANARADALLHRLAEPGPQFHALWSLAYATQSVSAWLVWRADASHGEYDVPAFTAYGAQLGLSVAWAMWFFGFRKPAVALVNACVLWIAVAVTVVEFARRHRLAAMLFLPYLLWATYATVVNAATWWTARGDSQGAAQWAAR